MRKARWLCYETSQNAHIRRVCSAFSSPCALPSNLIHIFEITFSGNAVAWFSGLFQYRFLTGKQIPFGRHNRYCRRDPDKQIR